MTGYLDGILARGFAGTPSVAPRLTGLFEPPSGRGEASVETVAEPPTASGSTEAAPDQAGASLERFASERFAGADIGTLAPSPLAEREALPANALLPIDDPRKLEASLREREPARPAVPLESTAAPTAAVFAAGSVAEPSPSRPPGRGGLEPGRRHEAATPTAPAAPSRRGDADAHGPLAAPPFVPERVRSSGPAPISSAAVASHPAPFESPALAAVPRLAAPARPAARREAHAEQPAQLSDGRAPLAPLLTLRRPDGARQATEPAFESALARASASPHFGSSDHSPGRGSREGPTLSVTIGRVEVRAVMAPEPVKRAPAPAQRLSLDAYLAGRRARRP
jgi:hypothetical protein